MKTWGNYFRISIHFLILMLTLVLCGCHEIIHIDQPSMIGPNSTFNTNIVVRLDSTNTIAQPLFGIQHPVGWSVNDSVSVHGVISGLFLIDHAISDTFNLDQPGGSEYEWSVWRATEMLQSVTGICTLSTTLTTDGVIGLYSIQYDMREGYDDSNLYSSSDAAGIVVTENQSTVSGDIFVSTEGRIGALGNQSDPMRSVFEALARVASDSTNPATIHIEAGTYSRETNGECFPLILQDHVTLQGDSELNTILDVSWTGRAAHVVDAESVQLQDLTFLNGHHRVRGGGILCQNSSLQITNVRVENSVVGPWEGSLGGGLFSSNSVVRLHETTFCGNEGYIGHCCDCGPAYGGAIYFENSSILITNATFGANTACDDLGIVGEDRQSEHEIEDSDLVIVNSIFWADSSDIYYRRPIVLYNMDSSASIAIAYTNIVGGRVGVGHPLSEDYDTSAVIWGAGNMDADPLFENAGLSDFNLQAASPCIDAGTSLFITEGDTLLNLSDYDFNGLAPDIGAFEFGAPVSRASEPIVPYTRVLVQNFPNPFNPITTISYDLPEQSEITLTVYDMKGREVATLQNQQQPAGHYEVRWNGVDESGNSVSTGVYFARLQAGDYDKTIKMVYLK